MYGSQFDGNAAFAGGGFMPQSTQSADPSFSPAKNRDTQPLVPLTVKQISQAFQSSDDKSNFLIDGIDVNNATLVGMVFNKAERITDVSFVLDDGTGRIDCIRWVNEAVDTKEMEEISDGMYVRVHGHLKGFQGKKQLVVFSIRPLTDYNEIAYHFVECMYVHVDNTKLQAQGGVTTPNMPNSTVSTPSKGYQAAPQNLYTGHYGMDGLKGIDQMVIDYLQQPSCLTWEKGVNLNEIAQQLSMPVEKITLSIKSLEDEGLVYSTIDEYHFKSTGNG
ncbi:replication protein A 32 kDa subunit B-like isoform X2 [Actinidia eriantha]|uniref:replication protein A 32 kDa subunit B-like isoform X2 n=1 Tax=Actinidia eriantha TaxID=165200 RepID=UPI00258D7281|nr:replication protein A 32 kDa subunit B-like isoform X2 [Actinidia eriantha]